MAELLEPARQQMARRTSSYEHTRADLPDVHRSSDCRRDQWGSFMHLRISGVSCSRNSGNAKWFQAFEA
eukprot:8140435-Alexandrium_andersonii.AAC.1